MMSGIRKNNLVILVLVWSGLIYGVLQIHFQNNLAQFSVCGPWGCGPSSNTLLAIHLMWLAIILPPSIYFQTIPCQSRIWMQRIAWLMVMAGLAGVLTIVAWQWLVWLPTAGESFRQYVWQRCGFAILTAVDWPWLQLIVSGVCMRITSRFAGASRCLDQVPPSARHCNPSNPDHRV